MPQLGKNMPFEICLLSHKFKKKINKFSLYSLSGRNKRLDEVGKGFHKIRESFKEFLSSKTEESYIF